MVDELVVRYKETPETLLWILYYRSTVYYGKVGLASINEVQEVVEVLYLVGTIRKAWKLHRARFIIGTSKVPVHSRQQLGWEKSLALLQSCPHHIQGIPRGKLVQVVSIAP